MLKRAVWVVTMVALSVAVASLAVAKKPTRAERCAAAKLKAASRKVAAKLKCYQTAITAGGRLRPACLGRAEATFTAAFSQAEAPGGCATTGDAPAIEMQVDADVGELVGALTPVTIVTTPTATSTTSTSTTTLPSSSTTTTLTPCSSLGSACGGCGSGTCRPDAGGGNICAGGLCSGGPCAVDADCGGGMVCIVVPLGLGTTTTCCTSCP